MSLSASSTFDVLDASTESAEVTVIVQPAAGYGTGGRGRLVHPTLGTLDYVVSPDEVVDFDGAPLYRPQWARGQTLGGQVDTLWPGFLRDAVVIERWRNGEVGCPIAHLRALWAFFAAPPDPAAGQVVLWHPNYASAAAYKVALANLRAGGERITIDRRLAGYGFAPQPVELELRILGAV